MYNILTFSYLWIIWPAFGLCCEKCLHILNAPWGKTSFENPNIRRFSKRLRDYPKGTSIRKLIDFKQNKANTTKEGEGNGEMKSAAFVAICWWSSNSVLSSWCMTGLYFSRSLETDLSQMERAGRIICQLLDLSFQTPTVSCQFHSNWTMIISTS